MSDSNDSKMAEKSSGEIHIAVKTIDGKEYFLQVPREIPIPELRERLHQESGIAPENQRLIFRGRVLKDDAPTLAHYNVDDGHTLHMVVRMPGTGPSRQAPAEEQAAEDRAGHGQPQGQGQAQGQGAGANGAGGRRVPGIHHQLMMAIEIPESGNTMNDLNQIITGVLSSMGLGGLNLGQDMGSNPPPPHQQGAPSRPAQPDTGAPQTPGVSGEGEGERPTGAAGGAAAAAAAGAGGGVPRTQVMESPPHSLAVMERFLGTLEGMMDEAASEQADARVAAPPSAQAPQAGSPSPLDTTMHEARPVSPLRAHSASPGVASLGQVPPLSPAPTTTGLPSAAAMAASPALPATPPTPSTPAPPPPGPPPPPPSLADLQAVLLRAERLVGERLGPMLQRALANISTLACRAEPSAAAASSTAPSPAAASPSAPSAERPSMGAPAQPASAISDQPQPPQQQQQQQQPTVLSPEQRTLSQQVAPALHSLGALFMELARATGTVARMTPQGTLPPLSPLFLTNAPAAAPMHQGPFAGTNNISIHVHTTAPLAGGMAGIPFGMMPLFPQPPPTMPMPTGAPGAAAPAATRASAPPPGARQPTNQSPAATMPPPGSTASASAADNSDPVQGANSAAAVGTTQAGAPGPVPPPLPPFQVYTFDALGNLQGPGLGPAGGGSATVPPGGTAAFHLGTMSIPLSGFWLPAPGGASGAPPAVLLSGVGADGGATSDAGGAGGATTGVTSDSNASTRAGGGGGAGGTATHPGHGSHGAAAAGGPPQNAPPINVTPLFNVFNSISQAMLGPGMAAGAAAAAAAAANNAASAPSATGSGTGGAAGAGTGRAPPGGSSFMFSFGPSPVTAGSNAGGGSGTGAAAGTAGSGAGAGVPPGTVINRHNIRLQFNSGVPTSVNVSTGPSAPPSSTAGAAAARAGMPGGPGAGATAMPPQPSLPHHQQALAQNILNTMAPLLATRPGGAGGAAPAPTATLPGMPAAAGTTTAAGTAPRDGVVLQQQLQQQLWELQQRQRQLQQQQETMEGQVADARQQQQHAQQQLQQHLQQQGTERKAEAAQPSGVAAPPVSASSVSATPAPASGVPAAPQASTTASARTGAPSPAPGGLPMLPPRRQARAPSTVASASTPSTATPSAASPSNKTSSSSSGAAMATASPAGQLQARQASQASPGSAAAPPFDPTRLLQSMLGGGSPAAGGAGGGNSGGAGSLGGLLGQLAGGARGGGQGGGAAPPADFFGSIMSQLMSDPAINSLADQLAGNMGAGAEGDSDDEDDEDGGANSGGRGRSRAHRPRGTEGAGIPGDLGSMMAQMLPQIMPMMTQMLGGRSGGGAGGLSQLAGGPQAQPAEGDARRGGGGGNGAMVAARDVPAGGAPGDRRRADADGASSQEEAFSALNEEEQATWMRIVDRDMEAQENMPEQPPFSDAYASGSPGKRKRVHS